MPREDWPQRLPGMGLAAGIALLATELGKLPLLQDKGITTLTLAIVLGMVAGNTFYPRMAAACAPGVAFSKANLLRLGIVLYGLRLTFQDIGRVGIAGVAIDAAVLASTFLLACLLGTRLFKLDSKTAMLIGAGSAICGAAAVLATEPVVKARAGQVTVAVSTVVVFGTLATFLYPALYHLAAPDPAAFGIYTGSTVHEVAQVLAAARAVGADAANTAVIAKMVRVMMLAPFLLVLSAWLSKRHAAQGTQDGGRAPGRIAIPWFALAFVLVAGLNSFAILPRGLVGHVLDADTFVLAMAMAALGLATHLSALRAAGIRPLLLAALLAGWLVAGGFAINKAIGAWLG